MIVTRFAPSPTGLLHLGHAFAAITASEMGERFLVRIEDIDLTRSRDEYVHAIFEDLVWLGLSWEEPVLRQRARFPAYKTALEKLKAQGLLYPCFCTRKEIEDEIARANDAPSGPEGHLYPGTCRTLSDVEREVRIARGEAYALRLDAHKASLQVGMLQFAEEGEGPSGESGTITVDPLLFGDVVLSRKETPASYHLAVVVDDAFQGVTLVTRGHDLFAAAHIQRVLQTLLGLPTPHYAHHRLLLDASGKKFAKRDKSATLHDLRHAGVTLADVRARIEL